jgi:hypothetical protein
MIRTLLALLLLGAAAPAFADKPPISAKGIGSGDSARTIGTLCSAQTATSTGCTTALGALVVYDGVASTSNVIVLDARPFSSIALYANQATATTFTCDLYTSDNGYDADSGVGQDRTTTALTETQQMVSIEGSFAYVWMECSGIADNSLTITFVARK